MGPIGSPEFLDICPLKMGLIGSPKTSVLNRLKLRNNPEDGRIQEFLRLS